MDWATADIMVLGGRRRSLRSSQSTIDEIRRFDWNLISIARPDCNLNHALALHHQPISLNQLCEINRTFLITLLSQFINWPRDLSTLFVPAIYQRLWAQPLRNVLFISHFWTMAEELSMLTTRVCPNHPLS